MSDNLTVFGTDYTGVTGIKAKGTGNGTLTYIRPSGTKNIGANGTGIDVTEYASVDVAVPGVTPTGNINITQSGVTDVTNYATATVPYATFYVAVVGNEFYTDGPDRKWHIRASADLDVSEGDVEGWHGQGTQFGNYVEFAAVPANTTVTPTTSAQTIGGANYMMEGPVTVAAMPTGTAGTPTATKGSVSNHSVSVTPSVTNTTGYITSGTKTGTAVSVSASELVSGTYTVSASGTHDVTNYASASVAAGGATASATKGTVSNHSVTVTPSVTRTAGYVTAGSANGTAVTVSASELVSGSETKTENGTYDVTNLAQLVVDVQGGGSSGMQVATTTATPSTAASSISFTVSGQPTSFYLTSAADLATGAAPYKVAAVTYDGTDLHGQIVTNTSNAQASYSTAFTQSYSSGTLTISSTGANFQANQYKLVYTYGGNSANIGTAETQVGSGATSITFTGLTDEPTCFGVIFKSDFSTSSGYQRVIAVTHDGSSTYGLAMDSGANAQSSWSYTYSNGSLTVTSQGTNNGGYFHQPGYYQLTYGIGGEVEPTEIDVQPLSVTQNGVYTAPDGVAYSPVTVNVSGSGSVRVGTTTWSNNSTSTVSHQFTGLSGTPKAAFLRCTSQLTRSSSNTYYYIADIFWDGTNAYGNYHLRSNGSYNNVASDAQSGFNVSVSGTSITFSSDATSRSSAPGSFYNGTYELVYVY